MMKFTLLATALLASTSVLAAGVADKISVEDPYVRMVPPNAPATAAFMTLKNTDGKDHAVVSAKAYINQKTELHTHIHENGVMRMREVPQIDIPAHGEQFLKPGGFHVMLIGLKSPIKEGQEVKIDLTFEDGSSKTIEAVGRPIKPMMPMAAKMDGKMPGMMHGHMAGHHGDAPKMLSNGMHTSPMADVLHANPAMPNLMGIAVKNAKELGLNDDQVAKLKLWAKNNSGKMHSLYAEVVALDKALIQDSLAGQTAEQLMTKFDKTLQLRREIAQTKIACRDNMRKILTAEQFAQLASIYPMM